MKKYFISLFEIYKLMFTIIIKILIYLSEINSIDNLDFNFNIILI